MVVDFDISDVDAAFDEFYEEVKGEYEVDETGLTLKNETEYASFVEAKGFEVLSGAVLEAERLLKEKFE